MATFYYVGSTLDGFLADPDDSLQWLFDVPQCEESERSMNAYIASAGALVMGATTYQWILDHEDLLANPSAWAYGDTPTWVLTHRTLPPVPGANLQIGPRDVASLHEELVQAAGGKDVWVVGGGDVAGQFADAGLLDEVHVAVAPVTLGAGAPLLPRRIHSDRMTLRSVAQLGQFALLVYDLG